MHIQCPSLGSRKWSADHYAVRSLVSPKRQETQNQNKTAKTKQKTTTKTHKRPREDWQDAPKGQAACANELRDLAQKQRPNNRTQGKILRRCQAKQTTQQRRNPGSPLLVRVVVCPDTGWRGYWVGWLVGGVAFCFLGDFPGTGRLPADVMFWGIPQLL